MKITETTPRTPRTYQLEVTEEEAALLWAAVGECSPETIRKALAVYREEGRYLRVVHLVERALLPRAATYQLYIALGKALAPGNQP